jgi:lipopolysaccharide/colanic/teichoic acid biosynthesis glycosyltransferase
MVCTDNEGCHSVEGELTPKSLLPATLVATPDQSALGISEEVHGFEKQSAARKQTANPRSSIHLVRSRVSVWSHSSAKRLFDCVAIIPVLPFVAPVFLLIGLAVRLTSKGPALFMQKRMGRNGRTFTIVKFRTLEHGHDKTHQAVTTADNQRFTPVGPFLRRWKLDELPQLWNVLKGDMSLVGPRPKLPEHQIGQLRCRPGITGAATLAFAREESFLARLPKHELDCCYHEKILPAKQQLDLEYMARATFSSDFKMLVNTVLRRWDTKVMESVLTGAMLEDNSRVSAQLVVTHAHMSILNSDADLTGEQQFTEA